MPKKLDSKEFDEILNIIGLFPEGATLKQIGQSLKMSLQRRTLQRRLVILVQEGRLVINGKSRSRRYLIANISKKNTSIIQKSIHDSIPLSPKSIRLQKLVNTPMRERTPVGYNRRFLDNYRPNVTSYLSKSVRQELFELGKTDGERPAGTYAREIFNRLLIDLSWNSSRLEGNTYSLLETERLLELSEAAEGKELAETQMILNHKTAIEFIIDSAESIKINRQVVLNVHALLSDNLLKDPGACGRLRSRPIGIAQSVYQPLLVPDVINECFNQILDTARAIDNPIEQAFFLMVQLPYLQPFEDVNKRVSRLVANIPLIQFNLSPLSFIDVPQKIYIDGLLVIYELNDIDLLRDVFIWAYKRSCALYSASRQTLGDPDPFRLRYRSVIFETIANIVKGCLNKKEAVAVIKMKATQVLPANDQEKFIEIVESELRALHEGNIARYKLSQSEYLVWYAIWQQKKKR
jgi:hypothetical protein